MKKKIIKVVCGAPNTKEGLLTISAGEKVIRIVPPLIINDKQVDLLLTKLKYALYNIIQ